MKIKKVVFNLLVVVSGKRKNLKVKKRLFGYVAFDEIPDRVILKGKFYDYKYEK